MHHHDDFQIINALEVCPKAIKNSFNNTPNILLLS